MFRVGGCWFSKYPHRVIAMIPERSWVWPIAICFSLACASVHSSPVPAATPHPVAAVPAPIATPSDSVGRGPWTFTRTAGRATYLVTRNAVIQRADSGDGQTQVAANTTRETLTFEPSTQGINITAVVDSFSPMAHELNEQVQPVVLHVQSSALLADNVLTIKSDNDAEACSPISSVLTMDLHNLVIPFPDSLIPGLVWKDSVTMKGCQAGIPTSSKVTRSFLVKGDTLSEGDPVVEVVRTDSASLEGEGGLQQHRVSIQAVGSGTGTYYLDMSSGQVLRLTTDQIVNVELTTVANKSKFVQHAKQEFLLTP